MTSQSLNQLHGGVKKLSNKQRAVLIARYFKTGKGQYGEGDIFLGLTVPQCRKIAATYKDISLEDAELLLSSPIHEERFIALLIFVDQFRKIEDDRIKENIVQVYMRKTKYINNWDLVDVSAGKIIGEYVRTRGDTKLLRKLVGSLSLWERRIAIIATSAFINKGSSKETLTIAVQLLGDRNDLIQKAVGWMLREVGKRVSREDLKGFLVKHKSEMGRTALRYAIEHFSDEERRQYLSKE